LKKKKQFANSNRYWNKIFNTFVEHVKSILDIGHKFTTNEDFERLSTVETLESESEFNNITNINMISRKLTSENEKEIIKFNKDEASSSDDEYETVRKVRCSNRILNIDELTTENDDEIVEYGDLDLHQIENDIQILLMQKSMSKFLQKNIIDHDIFEESEIKNENDLTEVESEAEVENNFYHNENDPEYRKVRCMNLEDLKNLNFLEQYYLLNNDLIDHYPPNQVPFSQNEIIRYIYGWRGDVENASKAMIELHEWRNSFKPQNLSDLDFVNNSKENLGSLLFIPSQDIYGRPIIQLKAKNLKKDLDIDLFVNYLIYNIEQGIKLMPKNIDKILIVIDIKDAGLGNFSVNHIKKIKETTGKFYVERLANLVIINKGFFFSVLWKVVNAFIDERVLKKINCNRQ